MARPSSSRRQPCQHDDQRGRAGPPCSAARPRGSATPAAPGAPGPVTVGGQVAGLGHQLVGVVLPDVGQAGGQGRAHRLGAEPLVTATMRTDAGVGDADLDPVAATAEPRRRIRRRRPAAAARSPGPTGPPVADHTTRAWRPRSPRARWEKYPPAHAGAGVDAGDLPAPAAGQGRRHRRRQVERRPSRVGPPPHLVAEAGGHPVEVRFGELVAAGMDAGPEGADHLGGSEGRASRSTARSTTPATSPRHPAWTAPNTPSGLPRAIEAQSAVRTARPIPPGRRRPGRPPPRPTGPAPLPCPPSGAGALVGRHHHPVSPWTWPPSGRSRPQAGRHRGGRPPRAPGR